MLRRERCHEAAHSLTTAGIYEVDVTLRAHVSTTIGELELQTRLLARVNHFEVQAFESRSAALLWLREKEPKL